jgi:lipid-A-disaccharide synthase
MSGETPAPAAPGKIEVFLVATEESGDRLGGALMQALQERSAGPVQFSGVGGQQMAAAGLKSLYSIDNLAIIGVSAIPAQLPRLAARAFATVRAVLARRPAVLVVIDSPSFTLWIARFVRMAAPSIPIVEYVSPSVWAWRSGRARSMRRFVDHVLALLPFEPDVHRRLGGPPCSYVGHPLIEQAAKFRPDHQEAARRLADPPIILCFPGSRMGEVQRHSPIFGQALGLIQQRVGPMQVIVPTMPHLAAAVTRATAEWPLRPRIVDDPTEKQAAFRVARAALAKSGTVTLELAIAGIPMVTAYKVSSLDAFIGRRLIKVSSVILANLVIGQNVVPELIQENCTAAALAAAFVPIVSDTPERRRQIEAFSRLDAIMEIGTRAPAMRAADIILGVLQRAHPAKLAAPPAA